ncbi:hypothetical protein PHLCEN_2v4210 [Hermanssonia centrifuga]|uniref:Uncharacterized protein n=1 Tax=Hermanssonia centrifuga TaxID=98765 RepID=A0A2R6PZ07_9APHY|nr:hypothetical protein PHLCEN_2v4210 [Hermanssonia centrifuga]
MECFLNNDEFMPKVVGVLHAPFKANSPQVAKEMWDVARLVDHEDEDEDE